MTDEELSQLVDEVANLKEQAQYWSETFEKHQADLVAALVERKRKSWVNKAQDLQATVVLGEILQINEKGLRKALKAKNYDRLCDLKLNRTKLQAAMRGDANTALVVAQYTEIVPKKPYVRLTAVKEEM